MKIENPVLFKRVGDLGYSPVTLFDLFAAASLTGQRAAEGDSSYPLTTSENCASQAREDALAMLAERQEIVAELKQRNEEVEGE